MRAKHSHSVSLTLERFFDALNSRLGHCADPAQAAALLVRLPGDVRACEEREGVGGEGALPAGLSGHGRQHVLSQRPAGDQEWAGERETVERRKSVVT